MSVPSKAKIFIEEIRSKHPIEQLHLIRKRIIDVRFQIIAALRDIDYKSIKDRKYALQTDTYKFKSLIEWEDENDSTALMERFMTFEKEVQDIYTKYEFVRNTEGLDTLYEREREVRDELSNIMYSKHFECNWVNLLEYYADRKD